MARSRAIRLVLALAVLAIAGGWSAGGAVAKLVVDQATHKRLSFQPLFTPSDSAHILPRTVTCSTDCSPLLYHGGPVQHAENEYLFFWAPSGYTFPAGYQSGLQTWLDAVAAADGGAGNPFSVNTQYYDLSGPGGTHSGAGYAVHDAGTIVDTDPYPTSGCTSSTTGISVCLTDPQIQSELSSYITAHNLPRGVDTEYNVLTPQGVASCFDASSGKCSYAQYCGYHSVTGAGQSQIVYSDLPWIYQIPGCDMGVLGGAGHANPGDIDPVVNIFSHELSESMTDPDLNGWIDSSGNENGDKCAWVFSQSGNQLMSGLNSNGNGYWNVPLAGGNYLMQMEFDQRAGYCALGLSNLWTGSTPLGAGGSAWSSGTNWAGAIAPGGAVDTLDFPALTGAACAAASPTASCYTSHNDVSSLRANALAIDDGSGYSIDGNALTLGSGGISARTSAAVPAPSSLNLPITLAAPQSWAVDGGTSGGGGLTLSGSLAGSADPVQVTMSNRAGLTLGADAELGQVTVNGADGRATGAGASLNGTVTASSLNGTDGNGVNISNAALVTSSGARVGALSSTGGSIQVGQANGATLTIAGGLTLDPASRVKLFIGQPGVGGADHSQVDASGPVAISGALDLSPAGNVCPSLTNGEVETLITTSGALSGTFSGIPNGQVVALGCGSQSPLLAISYAAKSVTATVVAAAPAGQAPPTVTGTPIVGSELSAVQGSWSNLPTGFAYQWERCDASGGNCAAAPGATGSTYTIVPGDAGYTLRVQVTASNGVGAASAISLPTSAIATGPVVSPVPPPTDSPPSPVTPPVTVSPPASALVPALLTAPAIGGDAVQGKVLSESGDRWSGGPDGFGYQWQRCDPAGRSCSAIAGATGRSYTVSAHDVGSTIRVLVRALNGFGASTWASSDVVGPAGASAARIKSALVSALSPALNGARIRYLFGHGGYRASFGAPGAGTLEISWSLLRPVAHLAGKNGRHRAVPMFVSSARAVTTASRAVTMRIRLGARAKRLLSGHGPLMLVARATFTPAGQAPITVVRTLPVKG